MEFTSLSRIWSRPVALFRHYRGGLRRAHFKTSWAVSRFLWPETSFLLKRLARTSGFVPPVRGQFETAVVLVSESFQQEIVRTSNGPDLENELLRWLMRDLDIKNVRFISELGEENPSDGRTILVVSYDALNRTHHGFPLPLIKNSVRLATQAKKLGLPVWPVLPDTFFFAHSLVSALVVAVCGGAIPLLQNSRAEAIAYGLPNPVSPIFWTWNSSFIEEWGPVTPWDARTEAVLFAASGDERRISWFQPLKQLLKTRNWELHESTGHLPWAEYVTQVKTAKLIVTTNLTQAWFTLGPRRYLSRVGEFTVTGRTWEAFASGTPVLCNSTPHLRELGFVPGTHFLDLNDIIARTEEFTLPSDQALKKIGLAGHKLFTKLTTGNRDFT